MNRRTSFLLLLALVLIVIRVAVSWQNSDGVATFFSLDTGTYSLDAAEQKKLDVLSTHPVLTSKTKTRNARDLNPSKRNPFLFGRPPAPETIITAPVLEPEIVIEQTVVETRFSGRLIGMTELADSGKKRVLLETSEGNLLLTEGELIDGRYKVLEITYEHTVIGDTQSGQQHTLTYLDEP